MVIYKLHMSQKSFALNLDLILTAGVSFSKNIAATKAQRESILKAARAGGRKVSWIFGCGVNSEQRHLSRVNLDEKESWSINKAPIEECHHPYIAVLGKHKSETGDADMLDFLC